MFYNISKRITFRLLPFTATLFIKTKTDLCTKTVFAVVNFAQRVAIERVVFFVLLGRTLKKVKADLKD